MSHGPHRDSLYSGSEHSQFNSPRLVKREAGFPNPRQRWLAQTNYAALMTHHTTENHKILWSNWGHQIYSLNFEKLLWNLTITWIAHLPSHLWNCKVQHVQWSNNSEILWFWYFLTSYVIRCLIRYWNSPLVSFLKVSTTDSPLLICEQGSFCTCTHPMRDGATL